MRGLACIGTTHDIKARIIEKKGEFKTRNKVGPTSSALSPSDDSSPGAPMMMTPAAKQVQHPPLLMGGAPQHDGGGAVTWENKSIVMLKAELRRRGEKLGGKVGELRERLVASDKARAARVRRDAETSHLSPAALANLERHKEYLHEIDVCTANL